MKIAEMSTYESFLEKYPVYETTLHIDKLRAEDYRRLDQAEHVYLDYTGAGIYSESQVRKHQQILLENTFGNPHSSNPTSQAATRYVESARAFVLAYFKADPAEYDVIFTANASGALKIVGESYPFGPGDQYLLTFDNHNSVNGIREFAHGKGAQVTYLPLVLPDMRVDEAMLAEAPENYAQVVNALTKLSKGNLDVQKFKDFVAERKREIEKAVTEGKAQGGFSTETIERIERELKLL